MPKSVEELQEQIYNERFDRLDETLGEIKEMLVQKASASSVLRLEGRVKTIEDSHIPCASVLLVRKEVEDLVKKHDKWIEEEFAPIKEATQSAVFFSKHPRLLKMTIIGAFVLLLISAIGLLPSWFMWRTYTLNLKKAQTEQVQNIPK